ncbi:hypothetical protein EAL2_808p06930 (plasmid) [Peptoclostridium acidaminophilum DSM 3953]|uniref:Oxaloacetate decarboxylase, gamma chain n=1 Tax=Peptoclostridium acidaminophilum DSM 3953 TaxID=1286171 RepID=W8UBV4_PEPAC|nr:OadG family protein [Peptoclostridium acidaminophilum]AHM58196.1 hypothetical protein EAL2_808p06930 [Peptoclostridium acidaminophilum DSM 3953]
MLGETVTLAQAVKVSGLSMLVVFAALFAICQVLELFSLIFHKRGLKKNAGTVGKENANASHEEGVYIDIENPQNEEDMAAVIAASVIFSNGGKMKNIRIKSIKRVG